MHRVYRSGGECYRKFCEGAGLVSFPTSERKLMLFVAHLHQKRLAPSTIKSYLAAIRHCQISKGMGNPGINVMPQLEYLLKGVKRLAPRGTRRRLPITPEILEKLRGHWLKAPTNRDARMLWAASSFFFFLFSSVQGRQCPQLLKNLTQIATCVLRMCGWTTDQLHRICR